MTYETRVRALCEECASLLIAHKRGAGAPPSCECVFSKGISAVARIEGEIDALLAGIKAADGHCDEVDIFALVSRCLRLILAVEDAEEAETAKEAAKPAKEVSCKSSKLPSSHKHSCLHESQEFTPIRLFKAEDLYCRAAAAEAAEDAEDAADAEATMKKCREQGPAAFIPYDEYRARRFQGKKQAGGSIALGTDDDTHITAD